MMLKRYCLKGSHYTYIGCRNKAGGIVVAPLLPTGVLGVALLRGSPAGVGLVLASGAGLLAYIQRAEESEMLARFGEDYVAYRERTPFLLPRLAR
jgi:protein-S-isoprenylcysteine O-methyltransferase Ste14